MADTDRISAIEQNPWLGIPAEGLKKLRDIAKAMAVAGQPGGMVLDAIIGEKPEALEKLSYGFEPRKGTGLATQLDPGAAEMVPLGPPTGTIAAMKGVATALLPKLPALAGIMAGRGSLTADLKSFRIAEELKKLGADKETLLQETGWWPGKDTMLRYEIPDTEAILKVPDKAGFRRLSDLLDHPELFKAYPFLKDIVVNATLLPVKLGDVYGGANPALSKMIVNGTDPEQIRSTLLHEVQHFVQNREGFSGGGSYKKIRGMFPDLTEGEAYEVYRRLAGEVEARIVAERSKLSPEELAVIRPWRGDVAEEAQTLTPQRVKRL